MYGFFRLFFFLRLFSFSFFMIEVSRLLLGGKSFEYMQVRSTREGNYEPCPGRMMGGCTEHINAVALRGETCTLCYVRLTLACDYY